MGFGGRFSAAGDRLPIVIKRTTHIRPTGVERAEPAVGLLIERIIDKGGIIL